MAKNSQRNITKSGKQGKTGAGIFEIWVGGEFVDHVSSTGKFAAEEEYKLARPNAVERIEAIWLRGNPPGTNYDVNKLLKDLTRVKLATKQITKPPMR